MQCLILTDEVRPSIDAWAAANQSIALVQHDGIYRIVDIDTVFVTHNSLSIDAQRGSVC